MTQLEASSLPEAVEQLKEQITAHLRSLDFSEFFTALIPEIQKDHESYFAEDTGPNGEKWATLAPSTIARKGHGDILEETLRMYDSVTSNTLDSIISVSADELIFGTRDPKAGYHQYGTGRMPARPFVGLNEAAIERITHQLAEHIGRSI